MKKFLLLKGDSQEGIVEFNSIEDAQKYADNPSKILKREEIMSKLEEAARKHAGITPDVMGVKNLRDLRTIKARKSLQRYDSFVKGAEWQLNNVWNLSDNLPEIDNGQLLYEVVVLCKDYRNRIVVNIEVEGLFNSGDIIAWMDIPAFV